MEIQANSAQLHSLRAELDRREHARLSSNVRCVVKTRGGMHEYEVAGLSVSGALLTKGPQLKKRCPLIVLLRVPLYPEVRIAARVVRSGTDEDGNPAMGIEFLHRSDVTEDHIQSALLSEIERSQTNGKISDLLA